MKTAKKKFRTELEMGHKGAAIIVPFDPAKTWGVKPTPVWYLGKRPGFLVRGTINGARFEGWIGHRWGRFFVLVDEDLAKAAGAKPGEIVDVVLEPRVQRAKK